MRKIWSKWLICASNSSSRFLPKGYGASGQKVTETIPTKITESQNANMLKSFTRVEVDGVIRSINPTKAPGSDGIEVVFYHKYWEFVGEDVSNFCLNILNNEAPMDMINKTHIVIIPKIKNPTDMKDFRPINLCTILYKIIAKTLANKLKRVFDKIISPSQSLLYQVDLLLTMPYYVLNTSM